MATLIVYAVISLGLAGSVWGFVHTHDAKIKDVEDALWKPKLEALQTAFDAKDAVITEQNNKVKEFQNQADEAMARAKAADAKSAETLAKMAGKKASLNAVLAAPKETDRTKDCDAAESLLDGFYSDRLH